MFKKYYWQQPIYKEDLKDVLLNGALFSILGGILAGALDYLFARIGFPLAFGLILITYLLGSRMARGYYTYHILYPTLTIPFMIVALFFSEVTQWTLIYGSIMALPQILADGNFYLNFLFGPILQLIECIKSFDVLSLLIVILNIGVYIWAFTFCYRMVKGRN